MTVHVLYDCARVRSLSRMCIICNSPTPRYMLDIMMGVQDPWVDRDGVCSFPDKWSSPPNSSPPNSSSTYSFSNYRSSNIGQTGGDIIVTNAKLYVGNYSNPVFPLMTLKLEDSLLKVRVIELILRLAISNFTPVLKSTFCFESKIQLLFSFCLL